MNINNRKIKLGVEILVIDKVELHNKSSKQGQEEHDEMYRRAVFDIEIINTSAAP